MSIIKTINNWLSGKKTVKRKVKQYRRNGVKVKGHARTMTVNTLPGESWFDYFRRTGDRKGADKLRQLDRIIAAPVVKRRDTWTKADEAELQRLNDAVYWAARVDDSDSDEYVDRVEAAAEGADERIIQLEKKKARRYR